MNTDIPIYPLYNSTYTAYRLSSLYHGEKHPLLEESTLKLHARRLRDRLKGDTLRGVNVGLPGTEVVSGNTGSLVDCIWSLLGDEDSWYATQRSLQNVDQDEDAMQLEHGVDAENARGILIELNYEKMIHTALLLRHQPPSQAMPSFVSLPLLLVRMPVRIKEIFLDYLATAFDTRISPMKLRPSFLTSSIEDILEHFAEDSAFKPVQVQLTFPAIAQSLKNLDITISANDVPNFLAVGKRTRTGAINGPFTAALSMYLKEHIALSFEHPSVVLSKVACGPFALAGEGKIKLVTASRRVPADEEIITPSQTELALQSFYAMIIKEAERSEMDTPIEPLGKQNQKGDTDDEEGLSSIDTATQASKGRRYRQESTIPAEPPPPYELHDPARRRR